MAVKMRGFLRVALARQTRDIVTAHAKRREGEIPVVTGSSICSYHIFGAENL
jgi:hypothetical protein